MGSSESKGNSTYTLHYFNVRGRGEIARLCFAMADVEFKDIRIEQKDWPALKPKMPLGFMPLLEVDGKQLSQSAVIYRYLGRRFGLYGRSHFEAAKIDEVMTTVGELALELTNTFFKPDEASKAEHLKKLTDKTIPFYLEYLEKTMKENKTGSGYIVGNNISIADLAVFNCLETLENVVPSAVEKYPKVRDLGIKIGVNSNIVRYVAKRPKTPF